MQIVYNPPREAWPDLTRRTLPDDSAIGQRVSDILARVRDGGDNALRELAAEIEGSVPESFRVSEEEIRAACTQVPEKLKEAIRHAYARIKAFHERQLPSPVVWDDGTGIVCRRRFVPVNCAGLYVPGGSAPLFSTVLMLAIPAEIAGCPRRILCTPPDKQGRIAPAILFAASLCGVDTIYKLGGAQAIAAMAYGTDTVAKADKIFGPGNRDVMKAKQMLSRNGLAIDMPAGPSEVMVIADDNARPSFVAADLLSQAEHGPDSHAVLLCRSEEFAAEVAREVERQKKLLSRGEVVEKALQGSQLIVFPDEDSCIDFANMYAAEHLILAVGNPRAIEEKITAAGSIFLGEWSPESAGDYASGTNHTLPTSALASAWSGLGVESFMHAVTSQYLTREGLASISGTIMEMAKAEGLDAHAAAVAVRLYEND